MAVSMFLQRSRRNGLIASECFTRHPQKHFAICVQGLARERFKCRLLAFEPHPRRLEINAQLLNATCTPNLRNEITQRRAYQERDRSDR